MNWIPRNPSPLPNEAILRDWALRLEVSPMLVTLLCNRGVDSLDGMRSYLNPGLKGLAPLDEWPGLAEAAALLAEGLVNGETLGVWGDYDVDGITSTALVTEFVTAHGFPCLHHIPDRMREGYGLNKEGVTALKNKGVTMLLTVDSGISDVEAVTHAKKLGMKVVISDHHLPAETLPPADAIVNPRLFPCPCPALAGVGVAFFLMAAVNARLALLGRKKYDVRNLLDLVALGTLADVVNLGGQNRILVKNGLLTIAEGRRPGIAALKTVCNFSPTAGLGAGQVVYSLAPRINAAGRLGSSDTALSLLLSTDIKEASSLADALGELNTKRREEEDKIFLAAHEQARAQAEAGKMGLVLYHGDWHQGVIGIVASRVMESFRRPVVVLTDTGEFLKGSGRSVSGFDMHEAFTGLADVLLGYGGHKMAAGLSLVPTDLEEFSRRFNALAEESLGKAEPVHSCKIDAELPLEFAADFTVLKELELLQPFGSGNPEPVFVSPPVTVRSVMLRPGFCMLDVAEEKSGIVLRAKAWRELASGIPKDIRGKQIRIAYSPRIDRYNGVAAVELRMKDWLWADGNNGNFARPPL